MNADLFLPSKPSWQAVARIANSRLGRRYSGVYCREVADGYRTNTKLEPVLRELGVMPTQIADNAQPSAIAASSNRRLEGVRSRIQAQMDASRGGAVLLNPISEVGLLTRQRRILATHLRDTLRESRALRTELNEAQNRAAATALRLGNEIAEKVTDIDILRNHIAAVTSDRDILRQRLDEAHHANDRLAARLSKSARARRVTHIQIGSELFRNRTGARA